MVKKKRRVLRRSRIRRNRDEHGITIQEAKQLEALNPNAPSLMIIDDLDLGYLELGGKVDMITSDMLNIHTDPYGFQDRYIGRMPRLLHEIPEANIWECNPEYTGLIYERLEGTLNEENISQELLYKLIKDIILIQRLDLIETYDEKMIATCAGYGPTGMMECDEDYDCDEIMICDYKPYNNYPEYPPNYVDDFVPSKDLIHEVRFDWTLSTHGTQPIYYDIYRWDKLRDIKSLIAIDTEPGIVIYEPYGKYMYMLKAYNDVGVVYTKWYEGISNLPLNTGADCCSQERARCQYFNTVGMMDVFDRYIPREHDAMLTSYVHGSCSEVMYDDGETICDNMFPCDAEEICEDCLGFNVYGISCETDEYEFLKFNTRDGKRFYSSDMHGSCIEPGYDELLGLHCDDDMGETDFHVWDQSEGMYVNFLANSQQFVNNMGCPPCADFNIWDDKVNEFDNLIARGRHFVVSTKSESCGSKYIRPIVPKFGIDCSCSPCGDCLDLRVLNDDGLFVNFKPAGATVLKVSMVHGSCGEEVDNEFGLTCEDDSCPHCVTLKSYDKEIDSFVLYLGKNNKINVSSRSGSCVAVFLPSEPTNLIASNDKEGYVELSWINSISGYPVPKYDLYRDSNLIKKNISSPHIDIISGGVYNYIIKAVNYLGEVESSVVEGTSIVGPVPTLYQNFIAYNQSFVANNEYLLVTNK